ncbi:MAG: glutamate--tRNA ligase [Candidatus Woesearchaeota archaeon]
MKELIRKYALQNAIRYEGKANASAIIGKIIQEDPSAKQNMREVSKLINEIVKEVNKIPLEKQIKELKQTAPELLEQKKEEKKELPELKNAKQGRVVMRFAPSPSGALHIGHAYVLGLNYLLTKKYGGKLILRIEDTNPENIDSDAYDLIPEDAQWLTDGSVNEILIQSDRLGYYYDAAEQLVQKGKAYVCECSSDEFRTLVFKKQACPCRNLSVKEQLIRYEKMFSSYKPGEAVLRMKTDLEHPNPAMRDFSLMRINEHKHPKQGTNYRVWPLMNLCVAVDDHLTGVTHSIRGKDHIDNERRQKFIFDALDWGEMPVSLFLGRINFEGMPLSASEARLGIEEGKYSGWDDIRLPFLHAFKRRGYKSETFLEFAKEVGITLTDKTVPKEEFFKMINNINKEFIDKQSNRYFFVWDPVEIAIENAPEQNVELEYYPGDEKRGKRKFRAKQFFYIAKEDFESMKDKKLYRLMDCLNFKKVGKKFVFDSKEYEHYKEHGDKIFHWIPKEEKVVEVEVLMPDATVVKGIGEESLSKVKVNDLVQLERFGFCRCDKKEGNKLSFWYAHR